MNQGLKSYTKQLSHDVSGVGTIYINLNGANRNANLVLPLFSTRGQNPIELSLVYNHLDMNFESEFGKGFRLNYFYSLSSDDNGIFFVSCDGSKDYASLEGENDSNTILGVEGLNNYNVYTQTTIQGDKSYLDPNGCKYPYKITKLNTDEIVINNTLGGDTINVISNGYEDVVNFTYTTSSVQIKHYYNNALMQKVILSLTNQKLSKVSFYEGDSILTNEYTIDYQDTQIEMSNLITKNSTKVVMTDNHTRIYDGYEEGYDSSTYNSLADFSIYYVTMSSSGPNETRVFDRYNNYVKYYFDSNQLLTQETNKYNKSLFYQYDANTKKLVYSSYKPVNINENLGNQLTFNISSNGNSIDNTLGQEDYANINTEIWSKLTYFNQAGESSKTLSLMGQADEVITLSFYLAAYAHSSVGDVVITLEAGESSISKTFTNSTLSNLEIHTMSLKPTKIYDNVKVTLKVLSGSIVRIGAFTLLQNPFNSQYSYLSGKIQEIKNGEDNVSFEYTNQNKLSTVKKNNEIMSQVTYDENYNIDTIVNKYGTVAKNIYDQTYPNLLVGQFIRNTNDTISLLQSKTYKEGRLIQTTTDENSIQTTYDFDNLERLETVIYNTGYYTTSTYNSTTGLLDLLKLRLDSASNGYEYDSRRRLSKVTTKDGTYYTFEYTNRNKVSKVKLNEQLIYAFTYDDADKILTIAYGNSGPYTRYQFSYNSDGSLNTISLNGTTQFTYSYTEDKLTSVYNNLEGTTKIYTYDDLGRLVQVSDVVDGTSSLVTNVFDTKDNVIQTRKVVNNVGIYESYDDISRSDDVAPVIVDLVKEILFAQTNLEGSNSTLLSQFKIFPLHHNFNSVDGSITSTYTHSLSSTEKPFVYNAKNRRYCLKAANADVRYEFGNSTSGTIFLRAINSSSGAEHVIFEMKDTNGKLVSLVINSSQKYALKLDGVEVLVGPTYGTGKWQTIGLIYYQTFTGYYSSTFKLVVDGNTYTTTKQQNGAYSNFITYLGRNSSLSQVFRGQIEMMAVANSYIVTDSVLSSLKKELDIVTTRTTIDEFERLVRKEVFKESGNIISNNYTYKLLENSRSSTQISREIITGNNNTIATRDYIYDELGRVKIIMDTDLGTKSYEYNDRGFLISDNGTAIEYTGNGNIESYGSKMFSYDSYGRLISVDGTDIAYSYFNPLYPTSIGNNTLTWSGKRLTKYTYSGGYYEFKYNDEGLRTSKENHQGVETKYFYEGSRLITEIKGTQRLDFLYDELGQLYGFVLNNTSKYFYVRDILQNILGIVDESGNLVVKYSYNAFGLVTITSDTSGVSIGSINPFRYKGYYYDEET